jgi:hypothetical protein
MAKVLLSRKVFFCGLCAAAGHTRVSWPLPQSQDGLLSMGGQILLYEPWPVWAGCGCQGSSTEENPPLERPSKPSWGSGRHRGPPAAAHSPAVKDHSNDTPLRPGRGLGVPHPQGMRQPTPAVPAPDVQTGRTAHPHGSAVAEQRTTKSWQAPCVVASSTGGACEERAQRARCNPGSCPGARRKREPPSVWGQTATGVGNAVRGGAESSRLR